MKVHYFTPYSLSKDIGKAYNECMDMIPSTDWACLRDGDTCFLTSDWGGIVFNYAWRNPGCVLTCYTNRIHELSKEQIIPAETFKEAMTIAQGLNGNSTKICTGPLSGFLMLVPKTVWNKVKFQEGVGLLGVDTQFFKDLRSANIPILRMDGLYIWHTYRLGKDIKDRTHLK
jgi:hypothetical protein